MRLYVRLFLFLATSVAMGAQAQGAITRWIPPVGDWHDPANWDTGVPDGVNTTFIEKGQAQFSSPATAALLAVGMAGSGSAVGTAPLSAYGFTNVGSQSGTGTGITLASTGLLELTGADLTVSPLVNVAGGYLTVGEGGGTGSNNVRTGMGTLRVTDGDVTADSVTVGIGGGTGTNNLHTGVGQFQLLRGDLHVKGGMNVGQGGSTSTATGIGQGNVLIEHGNVTLDRGPNPTLPSALVVGIFGGAGDGGGRGEGILTLVDGNLTVQELRIGLTGGNSRVQGSSDGRVTVIDGEVQADAIIVGVRERGTSPTHGVLELLCSSANSQQATFGPEGSLVLGIGGASADDYGRLDLTGAASLAGLVEARFTDGFLPAPGDVFTLVTAANMAGNYAVNITGVPASYQPHFQITRTSQLLEITFVPEGTSLLLAAQSTLAACLAPCRRRRGQSPHAA